MYDGIIASAIILFNKWYREWRPVHILSNGISGCSVKLGQKLKKWKESNSPNFMIVEALLVEKETLVMRCKTKI